MSGQQTTVSTSDIARIAGVGRATVTNWRRRHADFPKPAGGTEARPSFDLEEVESWLGDHGRLPEPTEDQKLWRGVLREADDAGLGAAVARAALFLVFLERAGHTSPDAMYVRPGGGPDLDAELGGEILREIGRTLPEMPGPLALLRSPNLMRDLSNAVTKRPPAEVLGTLLTRFRSETRGRVPGTPMPVAAFMATLARAATPAGSFRTVLDPSCGTGDLLEAARVQGAGYVYGEEKDLPIAQLAAAQMAVRLTGPGEGSTIRSGDALHEDRAYGPEIDAVLCNPPYSQRDWGAEELAYASRWEYGLPARSESELAWVQHCLARVRPGGPVVMLLPPAVAARSSGRRIRAELLRRGALRAVIALPPGAAQPAHIGLHIWVLQHPESEGRPRMENVLFMNCPSVPAGPSPDRPQVTWRELLTAPEKHGEVPGLSRSVPIIDLLDDTVDLTPAPRLAGPYEITRPDELRRTLGGSQGSLSSSLSRAVNLSPGREWGTPRTADQWTTASVADLIRTGALTLLRPKTTGPPASQDTSMAGQPVLKAADVIAGRPPSGTIPEPEDGAVRIEAGDVIVPSTVLSEGKYTARVADARTDAQALLGRNLHLLRPDPSRLDSWFLAGFLADPANVQRASQGSSVVRVDARRLQVPLLPLEEQQTYGAAFRRLRSFTEALRRATAQGEDVVGQLHDALTAGTLKPPAD
ncbi:N-6 DNA methylase [Streptomyces asiaticus]|uniref:N-6 DNA methylase n=1 Tax=Streptomyces asiaticus TaxID=114695 RepID=UPI003D72BCE9